MSSTEIKGPAVFLAQFIPSDNSVNLEQMLKWAAGHGYAGVQIPTWDKRLFDLQQAAASQAYCDEVRAMCARYGLEITELSTHLQGQLIAVHPAYNAMYQGFAPVGVDTVEQKQQWATEQLFLAAQASQRLGLTAHATFSGALLWHTVYPWPQRPEGLVEQGFAELAKRWLPILDAFDTAGVDLCYELHPGEDLHDGLSFERFLQAVQQHPRACILYDPSHFVLQQLDYLQFIDFYHQRIRAFHVKDAEFRPSGKAGVYGGFASWQERPGRFRSLGDGQIDFKAVFSKLTQYGFNGWAVLEWECCLKHPEQGAAEGAPFIRRHLIKQAEHAFDDFAGSGADTERNRKILGLS
ncbi:sugar phosphate isomerase/epimerase [Alkalimonas collagenimarina]|uniref:Sugar phosphate isomerase/epimerase n=1 Tax=Alkalimonas collagenimarina TaxID=400390 RepID=A0ABT9H027_9GAMM|nr:sugar phosphate isomerase/epimerase [Alkalimonas collagenimarina]MDP4536674.1 sugar phosphate isomerase/epimerase [Alkalimonas collagenimarina]